jgi:hypothetical protein
MRERLVLSALVAGSLALGGCNHVPLEPEAGTVLVLQPDAVRECNRLGSTKVEVLDKVLFFRRGTVKMGTELANLARNAAVDMGGNAISPESGIEKGKQKFGIYSCPIE